MAGSREEGGGCPHGEERDPRCPHGEERGPHRPPDVRMAGSPSGGCPLGGSVARMAGSQGEFGGEVGPHGIAQARMAIWTEEEEAPVRVDRMAAVGETVVLGTVLTCDRAQSKAVPARMRATWQKWTTVRVQMACHHVRGPRARASPAHGRGHLADTLVGLGEPRAHKAGGATTGCASAHHDRAGPEATAKSKGGRRRLLQAAGRLHFCDDPQDGPS